LIYSFYFIVPSTPGVPPHSFPYPPHYPNAHQSYHYQRFDGAGHHGGPYPYAAPYPYGTFPNQSSSNEWMQPPQQNMHIGGPIQPSAKRVESPQEEIDDEIDVDDHESRQLCILGGVEASAPSLPNYSVPAAKTYQHHGSNDHERFPPREAHHNQTGDQHNQQDDSFPIPATVNNDRRTDLFQLRLHPPLLVYFNCHILHIFEII